MKRRSLIGGGLALAAAFGGLPFIRALDRSSPAAGGISPERFGAIGDGRTDDAPALRAAFAEAGARNAPVVLTYEKNYLCRTGLVAPPGLEIVGNGAILSTPASIRLLTVTTGFTARDLKLRGPSSDYDPGSVGIYCSGTVNGRGVAPTFISDITLVDIDIANFGYVAVQPLYVERMRVINPTISGCGYGGIITQGTKDFVGEGGLFHTFTGETETGDLEAMAISWSCADNEIDHIRYPPSRNCVWTGGMFRDCPTWAVLDTHGGEDCHFVSPTVVNCRRAIWLTSRRGAGPLRCSATDVVATNDFPEGATNANGTSKRDAAFLISGYDARHLARGCYISGTATRFGSALDVTTRPAAIMARTDAACGMKVRLIDPYCVGFAADTEARGHLEAIIENPQSSGAGGSITSPAYLAITATGSDVVDMTFDVTMIRNRPDLNTYVGVRALVSSGEMRNARLNFRRLAADKAIDMVLGTRRGTVSGAYPAP